MTYDHWKSTDPTDDELGPEPYLDEECGCLKNEGYVCEFCVRRQSKERSAVTTGRDGVGDEGR